MLKNLKIFLIFLAIFIQNLRALSCYDDTNYCTDVRFGLGMSYNSLKMLNIDYQNVGAFGNISGSIYWGKGLFLGMDALFGMGYSRINGSLNHVTNAQGNTLLLANTQESTQDIAVKISANFEAGVVLLNLRRPLIIALNFTLDGNGLGTHFRDKNLNSGVGFLGVSAFYRQSISDFNLEYKLVYGYGVFASNRSYFFNAVNNNGAGGHRIEGALTFLVPRGDIMEKKFDFYARLRGVWERILPYKIARFDGNFNEYSQSDDFMIMFEFGSTIKW